MFACRIICWYMLHHIFVWCHMYTPIMLLSFLTDVTDTCFRDVMHIWKFLCACQQYYGAFHIISNEWPYNIIILGRWGWGGRWGAGVGWEAGGRERWGGGFKELPTRSWMRVWNNLAPWQRRVNENFKEFFFFQTWVKTDPCKFWKRCNLLLHISVNMQIRPRCWVCGEQIKTQNPKSRWMSTKNWSTQCRGLYTPFAINNMKKNAIWITTIINLCSSF